MNGRHFSKTLGGLTVFGALVLAGMSFRAVRVHADDGDGEESKIRQGFAIVPPFVSLNMKGKDRALVGLGSYIVNAVGDCNGCHSLNPPTEFVMGGNPYQFLPPSMTVHQHKQINPATYLGGGRDFGGFPAMASPVHIISRNLTPDVTGRPEGGHTFSEFVQIMRTGIDFDQLHPTCPTNSPQCLPYPFDGSLLQIMRWPFFKDMTNRDLLAIYTYLSAVPCIAGPPAPSPLHNVCP